MFWRKTVQIQITLSQSILEIWTLECMGKNMVNRNHRIVENKMTENKPQSGRANNEAKFTDDSNRLDLGSEERDY